MKALRVLSPLHKAVRRIDAYLESESKKSRLNNVEGHLLTYLLRYAPCPIADLHRVFGYKRSTLTSILDRLQDRELVIRTPSSSDRRSVEVALKPEGIRVAEKIAQVVEALDLEIARSVAAEDLEGFARVMASIRRKTGIP